MLEALEGATGNDSGARPQSGGGGPMTMTFTETVDANDYGMPVHPLCELFPLMSGSDLGCLEGDILENGLMSPVVVHDGQLVDGRNRLLACRRAHVKPRFVEWRALHTGKESLARWIWSINAERRHLTIDQYLAVQIAFNAWEEQEAARVQQVNGGKTAGRGRPQQVETNSSQPIREGKRAPQVRTKLAKQFGVSEHKVQQALNVQKTNPELLKQVANGKVPLREAQKQVATRKPAKEKPAFTVAAAIQPVMRSIAKTLARATESQRRAIVDALLTALKELQQQ